MLAITAAILLLASPPAGAGAWTLVPSPNSPGSNELLGAGGAGPSYVWAVGRVVGDSDWQSLILRWNGSIWSSVAHPHFPENHLLEDVDAPAANVAWAVGNRWLPSEGVATLIERWNGSSWTVVPSPNPNLNGLNYLLGVRAVPATPDTAWAVGSYSNPQGSFGDLTLIMRHLRGRWRTVPSPNVTSDNHLEAVDATGPNDAWAVGWGSTSPFGGTALALVQRWNGTRWSNVSIPEPSPVMLFGVRALAPNDVWAVGHTYLGGPHWIPLILHWNGSTWTRASIPAFPNGGQLRDVVSFSPTNIYALGFAGEGTFAETLVLRWNGSVWTRETTPSPATGPKVYGGAAIPPSTVWGAGYRYQASLFANQTLTIRTTNG